MDLEFNTGDDLHELNSLKSFSDVEQALEQAEPLVEKQPKFRNYYKELATQIRHVQKYIEDNSTADKIAAMQKHAGKMKNLESVLTLLE